MNAEEPEHVDLRVLACLSAVGIGVGGRIQAVELLLPGLSQVWVSITVEDKDEHAPNHGGGNALEGGKTIGRLSDTCQAGYPLEGSE